MNMDDFEKIASETNDYDIYKSFLVSDNKIKWAKHPIVSISGGGDSDVMLDLLYRVDTDKKCRYVFFDTGLEYTATKEHLKYLEDKYGITIETIKAEKPIPITCKEIGQPFLNKRVSYLMALLQKNGFNWVDDTYENLAPQYPKCWGAIKWWCNGYGENSRYNIDNNKYLKEFIMANPPQFKISSKCCDYAKKKPVKKFLKNNNCDLNCYGVRKAEGGIRASIYKNCFTDNCGKDIPDDYRPLFWYKNNTKEIYEKYFDVVHSKCYTEYGMKRTGCAGCPFGRQFEDELLVLKEHEPNLYKAVNNIFGDSYAYTRRYREFVKEKKKENN